MDDVRLDNQIVAAKVTSSRLSIPAGFRRVTAACEIPSADVLQVYAGPQTTLQVDSDATTNIHVYLWGLAGHPRLGRSEIAGWIGRQVASADLIPLREIVGTYIALVDDRRTGSVGVVSDVVGTRPFFTRFRDNELICGCDVWTLARLGWISPRLNYDAIAAWVRAGYDFTDGSLFCELSLVEPGAVTTFRDDQTCVTSYADLEGGCLRPSVDDFVDNIHEIMTRSFRSATRELHSVQLAMSGGFDSRYLAALAVAHGLELRAACLNDPPSEGQVAAEVARRLDVPLRMIEADGSRWNMYDEPFHFAPSGFPITKQQSHLAAMGNPGMPCLNGFLGGELIADTLDSATEKMIFASIDDNARGFQQRQNLSSHFARFDLIDPAFLARCDARTWPACRRHIAHYSHIANKLDAAMCLRRHRTYFGNNFVQHLSLAEPILPFANYDLVQVKCQTDPELFNEANYAALLARYYPKLAGIPHNEEMDGKRELPYRKSKATARWAMAALFDMISRDGLRILERTKAIPRLIGALRGGSKPDIAALFAYRLHLLEKRLRSLDVELEWESI